MQETNRINYNIYLNNSKKCECLSAHFCHKQFPCSSRRILLKRYYMNKQFAKAPLNYLTLLHIKKLNLFRRRFTKSMEKNKQLWINHQTKIPTNRNHGKSSQKDFMEPFTFSFTNNDFNDCKQCFKLYFNYI